MRHAVVICEIDVICGKAGEIRCGRSSDRRDLTVLEPNPNNVLDPAAAIRPVLQWVAILSRPSVGKRAL